MIKQQIKSNSFIKKFIFFCMMLFAIIANAQTVSTTEEEYNYLTKGYKIQVESGLDMKKGYELADIGFFKDVAYSFDFKLLHRQSENEIAACLVIIKSFNWGNTYYLCIPFNNSNLFSKYQAVFNTFDAPLCKAYINILSFHFANGLLTTFHLIKTTNKK